MASKTALSACTVGPWARSYPKQIEIASIAYWTRRLSNLIVEATRNQSHPTTWGQLVLSRFPIPALTLPSADLFPPSLDGGVTLSNYPLQQTGACDDQEQTFRRVLASARADDILHRSRRGKASAPRPSPHRPRGPGSAVELRLHARPGP